MTILAPSPTARHANLDDDSDHLFCCCSPSISPCGESIEADPECPPDCGHDTCVRCDVLIEIQCVLCGFGVTGPCYCGRC